MSGNGFPALTSAQTATKPVRLAYLPTAQKSKTFNTYAQCYKKVLSNADSNAALNSD